MTRRWEEQEIRAILPQAAPILMLDGLELEPGGSLLGQTRLTPERWCWSAPFAFPGIYFIELAMQALTCELLSRPELRGKYVVFAGIKDALLLGRPQSGDVLQARVQLQSLTRDRVGAFDFECAVGSRALSRGTVRVAIVGEEELRDSAPLQVQDLSALARAPSRSFDQLLGKPCGELPELLLARLWAGPEGVLRAAAAVSGDSWVLRGHFKSVRIYNGLFLLQMCEQMLALAGSGPAPRLCRLEGVLFKKINHPGDLIQLELRPSLTAGGRAFEVQAHSENTQSMKGTLHFEPADSGGHPDFPSGRC